MLNPEKDNFVLAIQSKFLDLSYPVGHKCLGIGIIEPSKILYGVLEYGVVCWRETGYNQVYTEYQVLVLCIGQTTVSYWKAINLLLTV